MTEVHITPNTGPALKEVWAFISRDSAGQENVIGATVPGLGMTSLLTGNPRTFEIFRRIVSESRQELESGGQTIHLLRFSKREEIGDW